MKKTAAADIVIFGGGIAGLWLLTRLRQSGFSAILFESLSLGGGQTHKAQGIIHGGLKYALQGQISDEVNALSSMPELWRRCLAGTGEIDLSSVPVLSSHQYLWSPGKFTSKLTGFLASKALNSKVASLEKNNYPSVFQHPAFKGDVFSLDEITIDVPNLVRALAKINQDAVFKIEPLCEQELHFDSEDQLHSATIYSAGQSIEVMAQQFVFTAGAGNEIILNKFNRKGIDMQRRPLHMVLAKVPHDYALYAHCLGLSNRPRITITTHTMTNGDTVWYLGGQLAEDGITKSSEEQTKIARKELESLFPWLDFSSCEWASFMIDRAEPKQQSGLKPDTFFTQSINNMTIAWPTKLALAPKLADHILQYLLDLKLTPQLLDTRELRAWPMPPVAKPIWEELFCLNNA